MIFGIQNSKIEEKNSQLTKTEKEIKRKKV